MSNVRFHMLTTEDHQAHADEIRQAIHSGAIDTAGRATIGKFSAWLCDLGANEAFISAAAYEQTSELVRLHLLRAVLKEMEDRNTVLQWCVVALTFVSIVGSSAQVYYAINADRRSQREESRAESERQSKQSQASAPSLAQPQVLNLASPKPASSSHLAASGAHAASR